jgi:predicted ATP-binding protein involved in virulence
MTGIVLIDEVEQHLHPRWQLNVMSLLGEAFPKMQFIATTHSPLVLSGSKNCKIRKITSSHDEIAGGFGWRPEDVYRNIMDLKTSRPAELDEAIDTYQRLHMKKVTHGLSPEDQGNLRRIERMFKGLPGTDPIATLSRLEGMLKSTVRHPR